MHPADDSDDEAGSEERPSRSARKRAAEYMQQLGERLVGLREERLAELALPDELREALREARRLRGQPALARQYQYIGRLMRELDPRPIEQALDLNPGQTGARGKMRR